LSRLRLERLVETPAFDVVEALASDSNLQKLGLDDELALARLMLAAYRGGVDDDGETEADALALVRGTFDGRVGPFLPHCSFAKWDGREMIAAVVVTVYQAMPMIAFCVTHPAHQRQGHGEALITAAITGLDEAGWAKVQLFVNPLNDGAIRLYRRLGFSEGV
jgi:ribosomal protein S18 acetylase RimI-like enzyme